MGRQRLSFKRIRLTDNNWHSIVLAVSGHHATLTLDCGIPLELWVCDGSRKILFTTWHRHICIWPQSKILANHFIKSSIQNSEAHDVYYCTVNNVLPLMGFRVHKQPFPSDLSTDGSRFHIGSRRKWKGLFSVSADTANYYGLFKIHTSICANIPVGQMMICLLSQGFTAPARPFAWIRCDTTCLSIFQTITCWNFHPYNPVKLASEIPNEWRPGPSVW